MTATERFVSDGAMGIESGASAPLNNCPEVSFQFLSARYRRLHSKTLALYSRRPSKCQSFDPFSIVSSRLVRPAQTAQYEIRHSHEHDHSGLNPIKLLNLNVTMHSVPKPTSQFERKSHQSLIQNDLSSSKRKMWTRDRATDTKQQDRENGEGRNEIKNKRIEKENDMRLPHSSLSFSSFGQCRWGSIAAWCKTLQQWK